jgi:hypothetical protein
MARTATTFHFYWWFIKGKDAYKSTVVAIFLESFVNHGLSVIPLTQSVGIINGVEGSGRGLQSVVEGGVHCLA